MQKPHIPRPTKHLLLKPSEETKSHTQLLDKICFIYVFLGNAQIFLKFKLLLLLQNVVFDTEESMQ